MGIILLSAQHMHQRLQGIIQAHAAILIDGVSSGKGEGWTYGYDHIIRQ